MDNQDMVRVHILQGEREMADDNKSLGKLELHGIPPAPRGVPEIEISFQIDADGIMKASAKDMATGKKQDLRIMPTSGLSEDEIDDMVQSREKYRGEDQRRRELAESKNQLDGLIYSTSRNFEDFGDMLSPEDEDIIQQALDDAEDALETMDLDKVQNAHDALHDAAQRLGSAIYQQSSTTRTESAEADDVSGDDLFGELENDDFLEEDTFDEEE